MLYLRTRSRSLPSEKTVRRVLAPAIIKQLIALPQSTITAKIYHYFLATEEDEYENRRQSA
uniref:Uncharacterized protein n=2 Tax=Candidatus Kentrum eta TaxID=2126337 RepID=A0A450VQC1_9GAMM|nr:MAG: hypothetical protein BECKH772A_GA0070896_103144 [Candidatus Kentron sp. H]VFK06993.1 MAG: hypothetical protein BECKH772C_GA0070978_103902 [Candidatus Kentron sp. H]